MESAAKGGTKRRMRSILPAPKQPKVLLIGYVKSVLPVSGDPCRAPLQASVPVIQVTPAASVTNGARLKASLPVTQVTPAGSVTNGARLQASLPVTQVTPAGSVTNRARLQASLPVTQVTPAGSVTNGSNLQASLPVTQVTPVGSVTNGSRLQASLPVTQVTPAGSVTNGSRLQASLPVTQVTPAGSVTNGARLQASLPVTQVTPAGSVTNGARLQASLPVTQVTPAGSVTNGAHQQASLPVTQVTPADSVINGARLQASLPVTQVTPADSVINGARLQASLPVTPAGSVTTGARLKASLPLPVTQYHGAVPVTELRTREGLTLSLHQSPVEHEQVDAIVNSVTTSVEFSGTLSKKILEVGGSTLQDECRRNAPNGLQLGDVVVTSGGRLRCQFVIHGPCCPWTDGADESKQVLGRLVTNSLQKAHDMGLSSMAVPALGTGVAGVPAQVCASVTLQEVVQFSCQHPQTTLKTVRFVTHPQDQTITQAFVEVLQASVSDSTLIPVIRQKRVGGSSGASPSVSKSSSTFELKTPEGISVSLHKCEIASQQVDVIVNSTSASLQLNCGLISSSLLKVGGKILQDECSRNAPGGVRDGDIVVTSGGRLQCQFVVHGSCTGWVNGDTGCLQVLKTFVSNSLREVHQRSLRSVAFPAIGTGQLGFPAKVVAAAVIGEILIFSQKNPQTTLRDVRFVVYPKDTKTIQGFEEVLSACQEASRHTTEDVDGYIKLPSHWSAMGSKERLRLVNLTPGSPEYLDVEKNFCSTSEGTVRQVVKIERIQNPSLYRQYVVRRTEMKRLSGRPDSVERRLWHGTNAEAAKNINSRGFNRSYCGRNATSYGKGVYFAVKSGYSVNNAFATPDASGLKRIYQTLVLTGDYTFGDSTLIVPPENPAKSGSAFDTVVDDLNAPNIFVVFADNQVYSEYLITFR